MAREAKAALGLDDGVEKAAKAEEDEAEIVFLKQQALGAARTGLRLGGAGLNLCKTSPELVEEFSIGRFLASMFCSARPTSEANQKAADRISDDFVTWDSGK